MSYKTKIIISPMNGDNFKMNGIQVSPPAAGFDYQDLYDVTKFIYISPLEFYITSMAADPTAKWDQLNSCTVCMCELFEDIDDTDPSTLR